jgi:hypothetical protein
MVDIWAPTAESAMSVVHEAFFEDHDVSCS